MIVVGDSALCRFMVHVPLDLALRAHHDGSDGSHALIVVASADCSTSPGPLEVPPSAGSATLLGSPNGIPPHGPDRGPRRRRLVFGLDVEAQSFVPGNVLDGCREEEGAHTLAVSAFENRLKKSPANSSSLEGRVDADGSEEIVRCLIFVASAVCSMTSSRLCRLTDGPWQCRDKVPNLTDLASSSDWIRVRG